MLQEKPMPIILKNGYYWLLVMEKMDFNILDLYQNLKFFDLLNINLKDLQQNIIQTVWDTFKCLHEQNKTYVDLKLQNVMVNIESDEKTESCHINTIKLIDLDGICTMNDDERIQGTSFFPPSVWPWLRGTWKKVSRLEGDFFMDQKILVYPDFLPSCNEATAIWNLVIFMIQIYAVNKPTLKEAGYDGLHKELITAYTKRDRRKEVGFDVPVGIPKPIDITKVLTALKHALPRTEQHQPIFPNVDTYFDYLINLSILSLNERKKYFENNDRLFNESHPELKTLFNEVVLE